MRTVEQIFAARLAPLAADFGEGWLTRNARDLVRIAVAWAGFDAKDLALRLARTRSRGERLNTATVERVLGEMRKYP